MQPCLHSSRLCIASKCFPQPRFRWSPSLSFYPKPRDGSLPYPRRRYMTSATQPIEGQGDHEVPNDHDPSFISNGIREEPSNTTIPFQVRRLISFGPLTEDQEGSKDYNNHESSSNLNGTRREPLNSGLPLQIRRIISFGQLTEDQEDPKDHNDHETSSIHGTREEHMNAGLPFRVRRVTQLPEGMHDVSSKGQRIAAAMDDVLFRRGRIASTALSEWLGLPDLASREEYWSNLGVIRDPSSLSSILLHHMNTKDRGTVYTETTERILAHYGFQIADLDIWAWILQPRDADLRAERLLASNRRLPFFILIEVLVEPLQRKDVLRQMINLTRKVILSDPRSEYRLEDSLVPTVQKEICVYVRDGVDSSGWSSEGDSMVKYLLSLLLYHARRLSPPSLVPIAQIVFPYMLTCLGKVPEDSLEIGRQTHKRLCSMFNFMLQELSIGSKLNPFRSMVYNWQAQRIILEVGNNFTPALILSHKTYKAIVKVLLASKKSEAEDATARHRMRSWPPWKIEQDGMDAQRPPEADLSRAIWGLISARESGFVPDSYDAAMGIVGGRERDGTPTIHKRTILEGANPASPPLPYYDLSPIIWSARIEATRDVEEAWSAFQGFTEAGGQHDQSTYSTMLEKLILERQRLTGNQPNLDGATGDAKEQIAPHDNGYSAYYRSQLQPPTLMSLFEQMRKEGIQINQRVLAMAIKYATDPSEAREFLIKAGMGNVWKVLFGHHKPNSQEILWTIPDQILTSYLTLIVRFAPQTIRQSVHAPPGRFKYDIVNGGPRYILEKAKGEDRSQSSGSILDTEWVIAELSDFYFHRRITDPISLAMKILTDRKPKYRPAWNCVFQALGKWGCIHNRDFGLLRNDLLSWGVFRLLLLKYHECGLELDHEGFTSLCLTVRKAANAIRILPSERKVLSEDEDGIELLKSEFRKLVIVNGNESLTRLMLPIRGHQLHPYISALGTAGDEDEILYILEWMVQHQEELMDMAEQADDGFDSLRMTLSAACYHLVDDNKIQRAEALVESVPMWGGWPTQVDMDEYVQRAPDHSLSAEEKESMYEIESKRQSTFVKKNLLDTR